MKYIAIIDYERLDHSLFMKSFSEAMAQQVGCSGIILHGDSAYTERLIQTGTMREEATIRSTRDLNHRIVALLADKGVAGIGLNGYQKNIIKKTGDSLLVDVRWIEERPAGTHLVLSNLVWDADVQKIVSMQLHALAEALCEQLNRDAVIIFSADDDNNFKFLKKNTQDAISTGQGPDLTSKIPKDLNPPPKNGFLSSLRAFGNLPDTEGLQPIGSI